MKIKRNCVDASEINRELVKLKAKIEEIHNKAKAIGEELSLDGFRKRIKVEQVGKSRRDFTKCFEEYIETSKLTKTASTVSGIKTSLKIFQEFSVTTRTALTFKNINQEFYDKFLNWCFNEKDYYNTSTGGCIKNLKAFLNWATDQRSYNTNLDFKKKSFKKLTEEPEIIFLTYEELMTLYNYDFKKKVEWDQVRDVFCFGCFTGMRFSDIEALSPEHIQKDCIRYRVGKTRQSNTIPFNPYTRKLIAKYKDTLSDRCLPVISLKATNESLRQLFAEVKLQRKVQKTNFQGAKRISVTSPLCEIITFHISKKTFMTNFLAKGGSLLTAMAITGNKDFKTAKRYYKVVDSLKIKEMAKVFGK
jgi:site-specific recombinase XerD